MEAAKSPFVKTVIGKILHEDPKKTLSIVSFFMEIFQFHSDTKWTFGIYLISSRQSEPKRMRIKRWKKSRWVERLVLGEGTCFDVRSGAGVEKKNLRYKNLFVGFCCFKKSLLGWFLFCRTFHVKTFEL